MAAIAPWFRLHLPSCGPGFESQAHHLCFFNLYWNCKKRSKINKKRPGLAHFFKNRVICRNAFPLITDVTLIGLIVCSWTTLICADVEKSQHDSDWPLFNVWLWPTRSVTRFGEILALCQNLKSFRQFLRFYLVFGILLNLTIFVCHLGKIS